MAVVRDHTYDKVDAYLNSLADRHADIKDYVGSSVDELTAKLNSFSGAQSPFLFFYGYRNKLSGTTQRTFNQKTISFGIVYTGIQAGDYAAQKLAKANAEIIGLEILSRINFDSKSQDLKWLYDNFIKESAFYEEFDGEEAVGLYGMDFNFDIKIAEPLVVDPAKWTDGSGICT